MSRLISSPFLLGVNYPWLNYAQDFGQGPAGHVGVSRPETEARVAKDFEQMRDCGAQLVRWFLFGDGRSGFLTEKGVPSQPDEKLFTDLSRALALAEQFGLKLCFSLVDHAWLADHGKLATDCEHEQVLQFAGGREAFLENVLIPMFSEFRAHPALFAWEIANEPEWAIREFHRAASAKMHFADFRAFASEIALAVHEFAGVPVTLGSAQIMWVRAWNELGLDLYQVHYDPVGAADTAVDLAAELRSIPPLDKPLWIGELPARDPSVPGYSLKHALDLCRDAGLCAAAVWRWTEPQESSRDAKIGRIEPQVLAAWRAQERSDSVGA
jgi:hypothetical protein